MMPRVVPIDSMGTGTSSARAVRHSAMPIPDGKVQ
jgi:hypothetical protein